MSDSIQESTKKMHDVFRKSYDLIYRDVMDEDKVSDWVDFYNFLGSGLDTFLGEIAVSKEHSIMYVIFVKLFMYAYLDAKKNQPSTDFTVFRYVYANQLESKFSELYAIISAFENMSEEERNEWENKAREAGAID